MNESAPRPLLEIFRTTLRMLEEEPGPMTPDREDFMEYILRRIAEHESLDRSCQQTEPSSADA